MLQEPESIPEWWIKKARSHLNGKSAKNKCLFLIYGFVCTTLIFLCYAIFFMLSSPNTLLFPVTKQIFVLSWFKTNQGKIYINIYENKEILLYIYLY